MPPKAVAESMEPRVMKKRPSAKMQTKMKASPMAKLPSRYPTIAAPIRLVRR